MVKLRRPSAERPFFTGRRLEGGLGPCSLNSKEGMSASRRFHLRLPIDLEERLRAVARANGIAMAAAIRQFAAEGLASVGAGHEPKSEESVQLATLLAAEHAVLMVASILPEGERRKQELAAQAGIAAQERIAAVEADLE